MRVAHYAIFPSGIIRKRWRYRLVAANGENVGPASQSYRDVTDTKRGVLDHATAAMQAAGGTGRASLRDVRIQILAGRKWWGVGAFHALTDRHGA